MLSIVPFKSSGGPISHSLSLPAVTLYENKAPHPSDVTTPTIRLVSKSRPQISRPSTQPVQRTRSRIVWSGSKREPKGIKLAKFNKYPIVPSGRTSVTVSYSIVINKDIFIIGIREHLYYHTQSVLDHTQSVLVSSKYCQLMGHQWHWMKDYLITSTCTIYSIACSSLTVCSLSIYSLFHFWCSDNHKLFMKCLAIERRKCGGYFQNFLQSLEQKVKFATYFLMHVHVRKCNKNFW